VIIPFFIVSGVGRIRTKEQVEAQPKSASGGLSVSEIRLWRVRILPGVPQNMIKGMDRSGHPLFLLFKYSIFAK
jgi:hypothetical protein